MFISKRKKTRSSGRSLPPSLFSPKPVKQADTECSCSYNIEWIVHQVDPNTGYPVKSAPVIINGDCFVIGRGETCDFSINRQGDSFSDVSRSHLGVGKDQEGYFAKDLNSQNGTFINRARVSSSFSLEDQQIIWLASCPVVFTKRPISRHHIFETVRINSCTDAGNSSPTDE